MDENLSGSYLIKYNVCSQTVKNLQLTIANDEATKEALTTELGDLELVHELLTKLKQFKMDSKKEFILRTINTALKDIFQEDIRIDIEASSNLENGKINMKYDIVLYQNDIEIARNEKLIESNGGGVLSVISILFKMLVGFIYSENKFYMFDESLSQVSADYRPRLSKFLKEFCQVHGFTIILVSHTEELDMHADLIYVLSGSFDKFKVPVLHIDEKIGDYPSDNYLYAKIQNFQSIINLEFRFKGFTIIRGSNNIGKSATLRAINSVLFNDFDKNMQRITDERSIETIIEFGHSDDPTKNIKVSYKSQKVVYEFDGMKFAGKNLAFDKVKEKIESIGFRYINLKETYKNFKGNLKDQTERLSLTTQHDGLFLIGAKNSDSSKIFDFLFDSYQVAGAIARVKIDINNKLNEFNECNSRILENNRILKVEVLKEQYYSYKYYIGLIHTVSKVNTRLEIVQHKLTVVNRIHSYISNILYIKQVSIAMDDIKLRISKIDATPIMSKIQILDKLIQYSKYSVLINTNISKLFELQRISKSLLNVQAKKEILEKIINYNQWLMVIQNGIQTITRSSLIQDTENKLQFQLSRISEAITKGRSILQFEQSIKYIGDSISYIQNTTSTIQQKTSTINSTQNNLTNLSSEFNLMKCSSCGGIGYTHSH